MKKNWFYYRISKTMIAAFFSTIAFSILAHGFMFANNLSFHDDIGQLFTVGETYTLGRWFLGILGKFWTIIFGNISIPWWNGMVSTFWIALSAALVIRLLRIRNLLRAILVGALFTVFPVVTCTYAFMFTAPHYFFALFLCIFAVFCQEKGSIGFLIGIGSFIASIAIYQAYFSVVLCLFLLLILIKGAQKKAEILYVFRVAIKYMLFTFTSLLGYLLLNKIFLYFLNLKLSTYQGLNSVYSGEFENLGTQIISTYYDLFNVGYGGLHPTIWMKAAVWISIIGSLLMSILLILKKCMNKTLKIVQVATISLVLILYPFAVNMIYFITKKNNTYIHHIMRYSLVFLWILPVVLMELHSKENVKNYILTCISKVMIMMITGVIALQVIFYCYLDNTTYLKATYIQEQAISYFNTLIQSVKQTSGYKDEYPVAYLQARQKSESGMTVIKEFNIVELVIYDGGMLEMVNDYAWETYMEMHCGYAPQKADNTEEIAEWPEVKKMPCYPDDGSIAVCRGVVVVKFADE